MNDRLSPQLQALSQCSIHLGGAVYFGFGDAPCRNTALCRDQLCVCPHSVQTTRDMILTCVSSSAVDATVSEQHSNWALMERMRRLVQRNLMSPDLTTEWLCRELGVSRTRLYQLLEPDGGIHHYIQRRRLLSAHVALSDITNRQQIGDIAFAVGFSSAAHFSRAFSKEFGYSPREARNLTVPPYLGHVAAPTSEIEDDHSFDKWLRMLGHSR